MTAETAARVTVNVTREHIEDGEPGECSYCPIALAICEAVTGAWSADVFCDTENGKVRAGVNMWFGKPGDTSDVRGFGLSDSAADFITDFDNGRPVKPFSFDLEMTA